jgi:hypothetical protein
MIRGKISDLVVNLEKLAQARISRTSKLLVSWNKTTYRLDAQSSFSIDYSIYSSTSVATKMIFDQYFTIYGGGVRSFIIDVIYLLNLVFYLFSYLFLNFTFILFNYCQNFT